MTPTETLVARRLREYYNEVCEIMAALEDEEMDFRESEAALIDLDSEYAAKIVETLGA